MRGEMSTALDVDVATLVGEMEAPPCESLGHGAADRNKVAHDDGPATHYARVHCPACEVNEIKAYCSKFVKHLGGFVLVSCFSCDSVFLASEIITVLGPVTS